MASVRGTYAADDQTLPLAGAFAPVQPVSPISPKALQSGAPSFSQLGRSRRGKRLLGHNPDASPKPGFGTTLGTLAVVAVGPRRFVADDERHSTECRRSGLLARINPTARNGVFAEGRDGECVVWSDRYQHAVFNVPLLPALRPHHTAVKLHEEMCSGRRRRFGVEEKALHMSMRCSQAPRSVEARFAIDSLPSQFAAYHLGCEFARAFRIVAGAELR